MDVLLASLIDSLESLPDNPCIEGLRHGISKTKALEISLEEYIRFSDKGYTRHNVYVSRRCEITVLCLKKGQTTPIHDHGGSIGATVVRSGRMTEELFNRQPGGLIVPIGTREASANEITTVDISTIHRVSNVNSEGLVTINIYFPPLTLMNIYNLENTRVEKGRTVSYEI